MPDAMLAHQISMRIRITSCRHQLPRPLPASHILRRMKHNISDRAVRRQVLAAQSTVAPTNDAPNPYKTVGNPFQLPAGRTWGSISTVEPDTDGKSIWIVDRCGANSCVGSNLPVVMKFDPSGKLVTASAPACSSSRTAFTSTRRGMSGWSTGCRREAAEPVRPPPGQGWPSHREVQPRRQSAAASRYAGHDRRRYDALQSAVRCHHRAERRHLRGRRPRR